jgi:hypothetical protein
MITQGFKYDVDSEIEERLRRRNWLRETLGRESVEKIQGELKTLKYLKHCKETEFSDEESKASMARKRRDYLERTLKSGPMIDLMIQGEILTYLQRCQHCNARDQLVCSLKKYFGHWLEDCKESQQVTDNTSMFGDEDECATKCRKKSKRVSQLELDIRRSLESEVKSTLSQSQMELYVDGLSHGMNPEYVVIMLTAVSYV